MSTDEFRKENLTPEARDKFFRTGVTHVDHVLAVLARHFGPQRLDSVLDFGCGVGRLVVPFARKFGTATGVDVSPSMLEETRHNCQVAGLSNVTLADSDDGLTAVTGEFDLVHSHIVFQHIPRARGEALIDRLMRRVRPGGAFAIHVCIGRNASLVRKAATAVRRNFVPVHWLLNLVRGKRASEPLMQMNAYELNHIVMMAHRCGFGELLLERTHQATDGEADEYPRVMIYGSKISR
jgi:SAM-dependent methyltransferase